VQLARSRKKEQKEKKMKSDDDDILRDPYAPPEMLLGSPKHTKETDIWMLGCLLAHLLLSKPIYSGKDRQSLLAAMYKMIGTPASENYPQAVKFPHYKKPTKKYRPGVAKALEFMMKKEEGTKHSEAIDLISQMLALDPKKRITAVGALQHEYMQNYVENCNSESFRQEFVAEWMSLKKKLMRSSKTEEDEIKEKERGIKRKAMLMAASKSTNSAEEDDLYDMDDLLGGGDSAKIPKL
jgi:serine/threonine protein kinase